MLSAEDFLFFCLLCLSEPGRRAEETGIFHRKKYNKPPDKPPFLRLFHI